MILPQTDISAWPELTHVFLPHMVYTLDPATGAWSACEMASSDMAEPDFCALREMKMKALSGMGIPDVFVRALQRPGIVIEDWAIEGVTGKFDVDIKHVRARRSAV